MPEERRVVSVLFADVTGSTALGESTDPEDVRALLGRYYAIAKDVVAAHGGTLEKFIGDAVMAVFGIPLAHGDDAERALVAALSLRERVAADPATAGLVLRIGVNTGEVVATRETDAGDFLVTGDAVNVAARLQQSAEPGTIVAGERTCRAVSGFRFGEPQRLTVKGKREPIACATVLERVAERRAPRAPFLGREHDLAQLDLVAKRAFSERRPQLVTITAPAGTGKSRLVEEFVRRLDPTPLVAVAQCLPYGSAVTFLPLRGLVRGLLGVPGDADLTAPLRETFSTAGYAEADAQRLASLIGMTLGDSGDAERADREEVFTTWRLLIEAVASRAPLVVVFEDLHWASDTLLDLVEHVTIARTAAPLVMVALARPELLDRRQSWGGGRRNFTSLALEPLNPEETRRLVGVMTEGVRAPIAERIVERAGGNPFFVGELVRAYEASRRAGMGDEDVVLPDTVHATVLARLDGLPEGERIVLERAAVAGRTARVASVQALLPERSTADIADLLEALVERDMLVPQGAGAYTFRHIVIREVAYATLPRAERVRAHLRLAEWLEEGAPARASELAELIAYHYRQAIALSPGGRLPEGLRAGSVIAALERAARIAANVGAFGETRELLREAIRLAPAEEHVRLQEVLGDAMQFGDPAIEAYGEALEGWRASGGDPATGARLAVKRAGVVGRWIGSLSRTYSAEESAAIIDEGRRLLALANDDYLAAKLTCCEAFHHVIRHERLDAQFLSGLDRAVAAAYRHFAAHDDIEGRSEALDARASIARLGFGDPQRGLAFDRERTGMSDRLSLLERVDAWSVMAWDLVMAGDYDAAVDLYTPAKAMLRPGEPEYMLAHSAAWAASGAMLCGRWDDALAIGDTLVTMREEAPVPIGRFTFPGWVAALRVAAARLDTTRLARYRSAFLAVADIPNLKDPPRLMWLAISERDARMAREFLLQPAGGRDRKAEIVAMMLFDLGERFSEEEIRTIADQANADPPMMTRRLELARALNDGTAALRPALASLEAGHLVADAARAATLLALWTHDGVDRDDAERRLRAIGDMQYLQKLAEEW